MFTTGCDITCVCFFSLLQQYYKIVSRQWQWWNPKWKTFLLCFSIVLMQYTHKLRNMFICMKWCPPAPFILFKLGVTQWRIIKPENDLYDHFLKLKLSCKNFKILFSNQTTTHDIVDIHIFVYNDDNKIDFERFSRVHLRIYQIIMIYWMATTKLFQF